MRRHIILAIIFLIAKTSFAQLEKEKFSFSDLKKEEILLIPDSAITNNFSVNNIVVKDERFDTTTIGFLGRYHYLVLKNGFLFSIKNYLDKILNTKPGTDSATSIVIFIKKFWTSDEFFKESKELSSRKEKQKRKDVGEEDTTWQTGFTFKAECYYKKDDSFYPLFRFDTTLSTKKRLSEKNFGVIAMCLYRLGQKLAALGQKGLNSNGRKMTNDNVIKYNGERFELKILKTDSLQKGVYLNFNELRNNNPYYRKYDIKKSRDADMLFVTDSTGKEFPIRKVWGYSDGTTIYFKSADNYFPLYRTGNAFYLRGFKGVDLYISNYSGVAYPTPSIALPYNSGKLEYSIKYHSYQLDMETGEIY